MLESQSKLDMPNTAPAPAPRNARAKRDVFRFNGEKPTALDLGHVTMISVEGKKLIFSFYSNSIFVELADEESAKNAFEQILNVWAADVVV